MVRKGSPSLPFLSKPPLLFIQTDLRAPDKYIRVHTWKCMMHVILRLASFTPRLSGLAPSIPPAIPSRIWVDTAVHYKKTPLLGSLINIQTIKRFLFGGPMKNVPVNYHPNVFLHMCACCHIQMHLCISTSMCTNAR